MNRQKIVFTRKGLDDLKREHEELLRVKRPAAVKRLSHAKNLGDLTENSEYTAAREELSFLDGRIAELEEILRQAKAVSSSKKKSYLIEIGCKVTLNINSRQEVFTIVGEWEADPSQKKISPSSPLGEALLGKKVGDKVEVSAPAGKIIYKILKIN